MAYLIYIWPPSFGLKLGNKSSRWLVRKLEYIYLFINPQELIWINELQETRAKTVDLHDF